MTTQAETPAGGAVVSAGPSSISAHIDAIAAAIIICTPDHAIIDINAHACRLLGVGRAAALGQRALLPRRWNGAVFDEAGQQLDPESGPIGALALDLPADQTQMLGLRASGREAVTWLQVSAQPLRDAASCVAAVVVTLTEVTQLKEARDALAATAAELRTLLDAVPDTYMYLDADDVVARVVGDRRAANSARLADVAPGRHPWELFAGEAADKARQAVALARATGKPVSTELAHVASAGPRFDEARHIPLPEGRLLVILRDITERKRTEEALMRSEEKYRTLYSRTPVMLHSIDAEGRLFSVSDRWLERMGYGAAEVIGRPSTEFLTEESRRFAVEKVLPEFFRTGTCVDVPYQMVCKDGEVVDVLLSATAERDSAGRVARSLAVLVDVTAQRAAESELARQEGELDAIVDAAPMLLWTIDRDLVITSIRGHAVEAMGLSPADIVGHSLSSLTGQRPDDPLLRAARLALTGQTTNYEHLVVDRLHEGRLQALQDPEQRVVGAVGVSYDVTERRAAQAQLHERQEQLRIAVDQSPTVLWTVDREMRFTSSRGGGLDAIGLVADQIVGTTLQDYFGTTDPAYPGLAGHRAALDGSSVRYEQEFSGRVFAAHLEPLRDDEGAVSGVVGSAQDVTEIRAAQIELAERERLLSTLFHNLPGMAYRCADDDARTMLFVSDGCLDLTNHAAEDLVGSGALSYTALIHAEDRERVHAAISSALSRREPWTLTYRLVTPDGNEKWVWERGAGVHDDDGALSHLEGLITDVTERRKMEDTLRERDEMLSGLVGSLPGAAYRSEIGAPWRTTFLSDGCLALTGYTPRELVDSDLCWADVIHPDDLPRVMRDLERDLDADSTFSEYRIVTRDGRERWLLDRAVFVRDAGGVANELIGLVIDITSRRAAEDALRQAEKQWRGLMANIPGMAYRCRAAPPWQDEFIGAACFEMTGYTAEQLIAGAPVWEEIMEPADRRLLARETEAAVAAHRSGELEYRIRTATGELRWIWDRFHITRNEHDDPVALDGLMLDVTDRHLAEEETQRLRLHDAVTGLPNRFLFADRVTQALAHGRRRRLTFSLAAMAVDRFAILVETLGHEACDRLLEAAADRLTETMRTEDTVAALAAGEFALLLVGGGGAAQASAGVGKVIEAFGRPFQVDGHELFLTLSLGVTLYPADGDEAQELIENAEVAARRVSSQGGNSWQFYHASMNEEREGRLALEGDLHRALERDQFRLYYQPVVKAASGEIIGVEALLRWQRPDNGVVAPDDFIDAAEETGLLLPIGRWALHTACDQMQVWNTALDRPLHVAVNLSPRQLYDETLTATVADALKSSGLPASQLAVEITETAAMRDPQAAGQIVRALREMGVRVALDDFGTGYSSLSHLVRLPIATVKIDRSFVRDLLSVPEHAAVAASVIALSHRLGLLVIAEGVETEQERQFLRDEGCDALQGYLFSRPLPADECWRLLEAGALGGTSS